jgi:hypothetical protein
MHKKVCLDFSLDKNLILFLKQRGITQLLNRPKSSPFASHTGCKQDLISMNFLRAQQTQGQKQTTIKT